MSDDPCTPVTIQSPDGASLTVCAYGGQVLGWAPQPGQDRLWLSPDTRCGGGAAIRGGVPVIFPQFSGRGPLPKHGFARDRAWTAHPLPDPSAATWQARLQDDEATREIWPCSFTLQLTARATASALTITIEVANPGTQSWTFALALHSYLAVSGDAASLRGLSGHPLEQNAVPGVIEPATAGTGASGAAQDDAWDALEPRDVRVLDVQGPVLLLDPERPALTLTAEGFPDRVAWNPGAGHTLSDVPDGAERSFVCCEPAVVTAIELDSGQSWTGRQILTVERTDTC